MKKDYSIISLTIAILIVFGFLAWLGQSQKQKLSPSLNLNSPDKVFSVNSRSYNFGTISMTQGKVSYTFKVKNISNKTIKTEKLYTSCMCTEATFSKNEEKSGPFGMPGHGFVPPLKKIIYPEEEFEIIVEFDPAAHGPAGIGPVKREIYLETDSTTPLVLEISAIVKP